jgi:hypothetical protein
MRSRLFRVVAAWLAVFAAFTGFALQAAPAAHADTGADEALFLSLTNATRAAQGLQPLATDGQLTSIARDWSGHMAAAGGISHNPSLQSQVTAAWTELGENVGMGPTVAMIQDAFMNSVHHRENILNGDYNYVGIGVVNGGGTIYVTVDFMTLHASASAPTPAVPRTTPRAPVAPKPTAAPRPRAVTPATTPPPPAPPTTVPPPAPAPVAATVPTANAQPAFVQVLSELRDLDV